MAGIIVRMCLNDISFTFTMKGQWTTYKATGAQH
jgi:hypothetical protein